MEVIALTLLTVTKAKLVLMMLAISSSISTSQTIHTAQIDPRRPIPVRLAASGPTGQGAVSDQDAKALKFFNDRAQHIIDLWHALQTRLLTDDELAEAIKIGDDINKEFLCADLHHCWGQSYKEEEKARERMDAFLFQYRLRFEHEKIFGCKPQPQPTKGHND